MGASGWSYFVPYQPDIQAALEALRQEVFEAGAYYKFSSFMEMGFSIGAFDSLPEEMRESFKQLMDEDRTLPPPQTIEELIERNEESGTHSILDITTIAPFPDFGVAAPLNSSELVEIFGTEKPTHDQVETKQTEVEDLRQRWQGTYIIVYKDDQPDEIFFTGFSGD